MDSPSGAPGDRKDVELGAGPREVRAVQSETDVERGKTLSLHFVPLSSPPSDFASSSSSLPQESTTKPIDEISQLRARNAELKRELEAMKAAKKQFIALVHLFSMLFVLVATSNQPEPDGLNSAPVRKAHYRTGTILSLKSTTLRPKCWRTMYGPFYPPPEDAKSYHHDCG